MSKAGLHAVATGDVVGSSELPSAARRRLPEALRAIYAIVQEQTPDVLPYDLAITGGDGWQCYVDDPTQALARVLHFWTLLYADGLQSRFALAIDTIDFISDGNLNESDGPAFRRSGRALRNLSDRQWVACLLPETVPIVYQLAVDSTFDLIDHLLHQWTEAQAQAVGGMLQNAGTGGSVTQQAIAEQWDPEPVTRQTVNRHLQRAEWSRLERTLSRFERLIQEVGR